MADDGEPFQASLHTHQGDSGTRIVLLRELAKMTLLSRRHMPQ